MRKQTLFGPYEPDKAPFLKTGLLDVANAYPTASGYAPVGQLRPLTPPLPGQFYGAAAFVGSDNQGSLYAGTPNALFRYSGASWTSVASGFTLAAHWAFTQFGDHAIAVNGAATQDINLLTGATSALTGAPSATSVATVRDFVVYGAATGNAALVQWSGFNDHTANTPGVNQAGYQPMLDGGDVIGIAGGEYGLIIQRRTVRRMTYIGATTDGVTIPWQFDVIDPEAGAMVAGSIAQAGRRVYFLSDRGFMFCDGNQVTPIGDERVNRTFFAYHGRTNLLGMRAAIDPRQSVVAWLVPGSPGRIWLYNWALDRWSMIQTYAQAVFSAFTASFTLEQMDTLYPGGIDGIPYSLDDPRFAGGDPLLLVVDQTGAIGSYSGPNMPARFVTQLEELIAARRSRVRSIRPITDALDGLKITLQAQQRLGDVPSLSSFGLLTVSGDVPVRADARYFACEMDLPDSASWSYAQGVEYVYEQGAGR